MARPFNTPEKILERYTPEPTTGCWLWAGGYKRSGEPSVSFRHRTVAPKRIFFETAKGAVPPGKQLNHTCDCPACVNPAHLYAGTQLENMHDKMRRGRLVDPTGRRHPPRKDL